MGWWGGSRSQEGVQTGFIRKGSREQRLKEVEAGVKQRSGGRVFPAEGALGAKVLRGSMPT